MKVARISTVGFTLLGVTAVYAFNSYPTVYQAHAFFHATLTPPLMIAIFFGAFWKKFTPAGLITTVIGGVSLMLLGFRFPLQLIGPIAQGTPYDPVHPFTYMAALYNLIVCTGVAVIITLMHKRMKRWVAKLKKNPNHAQIIMGMVIVSGIIILIDVLDIFFKTSILSLDLLFSLSLLMSGFVGFITTYYVKYDEDAQTLGLTVWSVHKAKEWFKGRKLNEREGKKVKVQWQLIEDDDKDEICFSNKEMEKMKAEPGDLVYITDSRKWLGGLKSCHTVYGNPHNEDGIVHIRKIHLGKGQFIDGRLLEAEKEM